MTTPTERVLAAFDGVSEDARTIIGESLELSPAPFLSALGSALTYGPKLATLKIGRALSAARWDGSAALLDVLSDDTEPWRTIRECLAEALSPPPERKP